MHDHQHYELVSWRRGDPEQNYRRFFAISDLAGLREEDPAVFDATHAELLRWAAVGDVTGCASTTRTGCADPAGYLDRLRPRPGRPGLVVEKILEPGERLPDWPVAGTTGYDAMAEVDGVLRRPGRRGRVHRAGQRLTGVTTSWPDLVHDCKLDAATGMLPPRCAGWPGSRPDPGRRGRAALAELLACFPVYRSLPAGRARAPRRGAGRGPPAPARPVLRRASRAGSPTPPTSWPCGSSRPPAR